MLAATSGNVLFAQNCSISMHSCSGNDILIVCTRFHSAHYRTAIYARLFYPSEFIINKHYIKKKKKETSLVINLDVQYHTRNKELFKSKLELKSESVPHENCMNF